MPGYGPCLGDGVGAQKLSVDGGEDRIIGGRSAGAHREPLFLLCTPMCPQRLYVAADDDVAQRPFRVSRAPSLECRGRRLFKPASTSRPSGEWNADDFDED